ncbi:MAG: protein kinase, partial [Planctomycetales bacterium]
MPQESKPPPNASLNLKGNYKEDDEPVNGYRLKRFIGQGSFGTVWEATAPGQARAALKIIPLTGKQGKKEFRGMSWVKKIKHPYLVPIQALFLKDQHGELIEDWEGSVGLGSTSEVAESPNSLQEDAKRPREMILVMGLGDKSLRDRLKECRDEGLTSIPAKELLRYIKDVAGAVDFLNSPVHDLGDGQSESIIHRDVKPQNIMLAGDSAQLSDFGLARPLSKHSIAASRGVGAALAYAAPETLKENSPTTKTDQYSLAITYYKLRTGKLPFSNRSTDWDMIM